MNNNSIKVLPIVLGVIILALLGVLIFAPSRNAGISPVATSTPTSQNNGDATPPPATTTVEVTPAPSATSTLYAYKSAKGKTVNVYLAPNSKVISPFTITGNVPAGWANEASFPVQIVDANGTVLGQGPARVPNWMSTTTAWFAVGTSFSKPSTATGFLVLKNDNPSGIPANADQVRIPVTF